MNGGDAPILTKDNGLNPNQPCSASSCERNCSAFETAQTKIDKLSSTDTSSKKTYLCHILFNTLIP